MRRIWEKIGDHKLYQFGVRSGEKEEFSFAKAHTKIHLFGLKDFAAAINELQGKPVYFSLDLDILDPAVFPGTGTPEAGGISFQELLNAVMDLRKLDVVGCDINELSPIYDMSGASTATACKILRETLLILKGE
jgi:agmatinase